MPNMKYLSLIIQSYGQGQSFLDRHRQKFDAQYSIKLFYLKCETYQHINTVLQDSV